MIKYCSKEYKFLDKVYVAILWFLDKDDNLSMALSSQLHKNIGEVESYIKGLITILKKKRIEEVYEVDVYELKLKVLIENRAEYWTKIPEKEKIDEGTMTEKISWLKPFMKSPLLYDVLVVPRNEVGGEMIFDVAKPFLKGSASMKKIEDFMYYSTQIVEPTAKHSAVYEVSDLIVIDWKTGKRKKEMLTKVDDDELMD